MARTLFIMFRDILSSRAIFAGLVVFVLLVSGSLFYYWHVQYTSKAEFQRSERFLQELETQNPTRSAQAVDVLTDLQTSDFVNTPDEHTDTSMSDETVALPNETDTLDLSDAFLPDDFVSEAAPAEDVPVSPHGFGAYPEVPADFPEDVNWADYEEDLPIYELMTRGQIKLWKQGHRAMGISEENGVMYPVIRGRVYIRWSRSGKEVLEITGHPADMSDAIVNQIESGVIPAGLTVLDYYTAGIDPYEFLNLQY